MRTKVMLLAAAFAAAAPLGADASPPPPVVIGTGGCPGGYTGTANVNATYVCRRDLRPDVQVQPTHCSTEYFEVGSDEIDRWVCVGL